MMYIQEDGVEANERHIAGERILSAIEDLTENGFEVRVRSDVARDGTVGWGASASGSGKGLYSSGFSDSIEGVICLIRDDVMGRL